MKIYRIAPASSAPVLWLDGGLENKLVGKSVAPLSPDAPFLGRVDRREPWTQFYRVGGNGFALPEEAWDQCEAMLYAMRENDIEFPGVRTADGNFTIIHPLQILPPSNDPNSICDLRYASTLFRIQTRSPLEVFCVEGSAHAHPNDEIKRAYEIYGFQGLIFEEVWSDGGDRKSK